MNKKTIKIIFGLIIIPFLLTIYFLDRFICVPLFWLPVDTIKNWFEKTQLIINSLIRVFVIVSIYAIFSLIL